MSKFELVAQNSDIRLDLDSLYYNLPPREGFDFNNASMDDFFRRAELLNGLVVSLDELVLVHEANGSEPRVSLKLRLVSEGVEVGEIFDCGVSIGPFFTADSYIPGFLVTDSGYGFSSISSPIGLNSVKDQRYFRALADFYGRSLRDYDLDHIGAEILGSEELIPGSHVDALFKAFQRYVIPITSGSLYEEHCLDRAQRIVDGLDSKQAQNYKPIEINKAYSHAKSFANEALLVRESAQGHYLIACAKLGINGDYNHKFINWHLSKAVRSDPKYKPRVEAIRSVMREGAKVIELKDR